MAIPHIATAGYAEFWDSPNEPDTFQRDAARVRADIAAFGFIAPPIGTAAALREAVDYLAWLRGYCGVSTDLPPTAA